MSISQYSKYTQVGGGGGGNTGTTSKNYVQAKCNEWISWSLKKETNKKEKKSLCKHIRNTKYFELSFCSLNWLYVCSTVQFGVCFCCAVAAGC